MHLRYSNLSHERTLVTVVLWNPQFMVTEDARRTHLRSNAAHIVRMPTHRNTYGTGTSDRR